ncbi:hypothetical protein ACF06P_09245 [Streptomyces sp. NPDC015684]|uniref:hypothetical protein n=1 Tax=unclassified Streptomyces TaxID=2593676 RepID=UPI0036FE9F56
MSGITMTNLSEVDLGKLTASVADWKKIVDSLDKLADRAQKGLLTKSENAQWAGVNSDVTRQFVKKTAKEFTDAHAEASSIYQVLDDACTELVQLQKELNTAIHTEAPELGLRVSDTGDGSVHVFYPHDRTTDDRHTESELNTAQELADRIAGIISHAREIDDSVSRALRKTHGSDEFNFGHENYTSLDDAQEQRAEELAKKSLRLYKEGKQLSTDELRELQTLVKYNAGDKEFATDLYRGLGPEGALRFQAQLSLDGTAEGGEQLRLARSIQDSMGTALATATPGLGDKWTDELMRVGRSDLDLQMQGNQMVPKGYQVLGTLLRHGAYPKGFLDKVGNDMIAYERDGGSWGRPDGSYAGMKNFGLNADTDGGRGWDPITGLLEAYGHNPDAATGFFQANVAGPGKQMTNLDYLMGMGADGKGDGARGWIPDMTAPFAAKDPEIYGKDALGHALEAAVSGLPYDHGDVGAHPEHTEQRQEIMDRVINAVATDPKLADDTMADSLGRMAGEYMPEVNSTLSQSNDFDDLYGGPRKFTSALATAEFLDTVGRNPDGYAEATLGAENHSAKVMHDVVAHPDRYAGTPSENLKHTAYNTGTVEGILSGARHDQIVTGGQQSDQDYNDALQKRADMFNTAFGSTVGLATERVPIAGEVINGVTEVVVGEMVEGAERNTAAETAHTAGESSFNARQNALDQAANGLLVAGTPNGVDSTDMHRAVTQQTGEGFDHGKELQREAKDYYKRNPPE